jgi:hypothetical protein
MDPVLTPSRTALVVIEMREDGAGIAGPDRTRTNPGDLVARLLDLRRSSAEVTGEDPGGRVGGGEAFLEDELGCLVDGPQAQEGEHPEHHRQPDGDVQHDPQLEPEAPESIHRSIIHRSGHHRPATPGPTITVRGCVEGAKPALAPTIAQRRRPLVTQWGRLGRTSPSRPDPAGAAWSTWRAARR